MINMTMYIINFVILNFPQELSNEALLCTSQMYPMIRSLNPILIQSY